MPRAEVTIKTADGNAPASVFTPDEGSGPWPGVIFFMDGPGIRPTMWEMGQRLADGGYLVLLPDLYYRSGPYAPKNAKELLSSPEGRAEMMKLVGSLDRDRKVADTKAFLDYLGTRSDVKGDRYGATGYCLGGNVALTADGAFPDRFAAVASFHGGELATDKPDSPHLFVKGINGRLYVAGAIEDGSFTDEQKAVLEKALTDAGVDHLIETYPAKHGFAVPDLPVYDAAAAERHWTALFGLLGAKLPR
jgi:carboxymethylenebutenolidase